MHLRPAPHLGWVIVTGMGLLRSSCEGGAYR